MIMLTYTRKSANKNTRIDSRILEANWIKFFFVVREDADTPLVYIHINYKYVKIRIEIKRTCITPPYCVAVKHNFFFEK